MCRLVSIFLDALLADGIVRCDRERIGEGALEQRPLRGSLGSRWCRAPIADKICAPTTNYERIPTTYPRFLAIGNRVGSPKEWAVSSAPASVARGPCNRGVGNHPARRQDSLTFMSPLLIDHRGSPTQAPENSLEEFAQATRRTTVHARHRSARHEAPRPRHAVGMRAVRTDIQLHLRGLTRLTIGSRVARHANGVPNYATPMACRCHCEPSTTTCRGRADTKSLALSAAMDHDARAAPLVVRFHVATPVRRASATPSAWG